MKSFQVSSLVKIALEEDLGGGDITSDLLISPEIEGEGKFIAKEPIVFCSAGILPIILKEHGGDLKVQRILKDGTLAKKGEILGVVTGSVKDLLEIERTALNFLQRLSGVSTHTSKIVKKAKKLTVLDTRKTLPGYRVLDKYAVSVGGGQNHRRSLSDMILIKNNHIDALRGGVKEALKRVFEKKPPSIPVEIEVRNLTELEEALRFSPDWIMLDNMKASEISKAIKLVKEVNPGIRLEVSGGVTPEKFRSFEKLGIRYVSLGSLTTKAPNVDISMSITRRR